MDATLRLRCSRAPFGSDADGRTPSMHVHSHWAQQVFLRGHGWMVWPGDEIGFSVIWTDWAIQVADVHIASRAKLGKKMASQPQHQVWEPPSRLRVPAGGGESSQRSATNGGGLSGKDTGRVEPQSEGCAPEQHRQLLTHKRKHLARGPMRALAGAGRADRIRAGAAHPCQPRMRVGCMQRCHAPPPTQGARAAGACGNASSAAVDEALDLLALVESEEAVKEWERLVAARDLLEVFLCACVRVCTCERVCLMCCWGLVCLFVSVSACVCLSLSTSQVAAQGLIKESTHEANAALLDATRVHRLTRPTAFAAASAALAAKSSSSDPSPTAGAWRAQAVAQAEVAVDLAAQLLYSPLSANEEVDVGGNVGGGSGR